MLTITERIAQANPGVVSQALAADAAKNSTIQSIHVADIATIISVDTESNTLTVKPIVNDILVNNQGNKQSVDFPQIPDTPYIGSSPTV
jgi:hypothetical protein